MKITKTQLKEIINEELHATLKEREQLQEGFLDNVLGFFGKMSVEDKAGVAAMIASLANGLERLDQGGAFYNGMNDKVEAIQDKNRDEWIAASRQLRKGTKAGERVGDKLKKLVHGNPTVFAALHGVNVQSAYEKIGEQPGSPALFDQARSALDRLGGKEGGLKDYQRQFRIASDDASMGEAGAAEKIDDIVNRLRNSKQIAKIRSDATDVDKGSSWRDGKSTAAQWRSDWAKFVTGPLSRLYLGLAKTDPQDYAALGVQTRYHGSLDNEKIFIHPDIYNALQRGVEKYYGSGQQSVDMMRRLGDDLRKSAGIKSKQYALESIDRDKLARIVAEELQKVLKNK
jgi:hypothetical protein